jgi:hypothetical protein
MDKSDSPPSERSSRRELSALDADFIRVLEDLIDALLANGTLRLTDLPPQGEAEPTQAGAPAHAQFAGLD